MGDKIPRKIYERELSRLQEELVQMEEWVWDTKSRVAVVFEGRDAAGKGGVIKRITEHMNPRITKHVALPKPTDRETTQWYFQRYTASLPAGGEIILFDRSWYNRAGVRRRSRRQEARAHDLHRPPAHADPVASQARAEDRAPATPIG